MDREINFKSLRQNIVGGFTAAIVALPLALAFGVSSGAGANAGLYGAIIAGFFAAIFGGTPTQITGPTGPMTVVMTIIISSFIAKFGSAQGLSLSFTVVVLAGCCQYLFGVFKWGDYINLIPYPVISAFMSGIGFLIIILQIPTLSGVANQGQKAIDIIYQFHHYVLNANISVLSLGLIVFAITFLVPKKINLYIPSTLIALVVGGALSTLIPSTESIYVIGEIPRGLPDIHFPVFMTAELFLVLKYALLLAALGSIDSLLTSVVADNITKTQHDSNQELKGQGIGNIFSGLVGGLPCAGATMRTMVNIRSGGTNKISGVIHTIVLLLMLLGIGDFVKSIPLVALSGVLLRVGVDIVDWKFLWHIHKLNVIKAIIIYVVILLTIFVDLLFAVGLGVFAFSLLAVKDIADAQIKSMYASDENMLSRLQLSKQENKAFEQLKDQMRYIHLWGPLSFGGVREMRKFIGVVVPIRIIDLMDVSVIDLSSVMILSDLAKEDVDAQVTTVFIIPKDMLQNKSFKALGFRENKRTVFTNRMDALRKADAYIAEFKKKAIC